jgi:hypothetical protein
MKERSFALECPHFARLVSSLYQHDGSFTGQEVVSTKAAGSRVAFAKIRQHAKEVRDHMTLPTSFRL